MTAAVALAGAHPVSRQAEPAPPVGQAARESESGFIAVAQGRLFYEAEGRGPAVILIHDGLLHRETWDAQMAPLAAGHRVVRYDRRGYGRSDPPAGPHSPVDDLATLMAALTIDRAALVGCSSGGMLAIEFALAHPGKVTRLVLVGAIVRGMGFTGHFNSRGGAGAPDPSAPVDAKIAYWTGGDPYLIAPSGSRARDTARRLLAANPQNLSDHWKTVRYSGPSALSRLQEIKAPALVLVGEHDIPDVHAHAGAIEAGIRGSRRVVMSGGGHLIHMETPESFNQLVVEFLQEAP